MSHIDGDKVGRFIALHPLGSVMLEITPILGQRKEGGAHLLSLAGVSDSAVVGGRSHRPVRLALGWVTAKRDATK